jgi:hypothetical protein
VSETRYWVLVRASERRFSFPLVCATPPSPGSRIVIPGGLGRTCTVRTVIHAPGETGVIVATESAVDIV